MIRTKRVPLIGRDVGAYAEAYRRYFDAHAASAREAKTMLDPAPRMVLDPQLNYSPTHLRAGATLVVSTSAQGPVTAEPQLRRLSIRGRDCQSP